MLKEKQEKVKSSWESIIPWFLTISSTLVLITIAYYLTNNVLWFRETAITETTQQSEKYLIHVYHLHLSMIKRSVGLFSGFSIMFLGIAVAFYTVKNQTKVDIQSQNITFSLLTASPGIIAIVVGAFLIAHSISSKDYFESYDKKLPPSLQEYLKERKLCK